MSFIVHARVPGREVSYQRGSMLAALEQALALASCGMESVRITDPRGRAFTPSEFSRSLRAARSPADARDREEAATRAA